MDEDRKAAAAAVLRALGHPDFRNTMREITNAHGDHPIAVALPTDTVESLFRLVSSAPASFAAVPDGDALDIIQLARTSRYADHSEGETDLPVGETANVGMLLTYLKQYGRCRVSVVSPNISLKLVDNGSSSGDLASV